MAAWAVVAEEKLRFRILMREEVAVALWYIWLLFESAANYEQGHKNW